MKNIFRNRIVIGIICIVLSLLICFGLTPLFNNALKAKVQIVRVGTEIKKGDLITKAMLTTVEAGGYNLPSNMVYRADEAVGKYANADLYKGDYILTSKLSDTALLKNEYLSKLNGENRAISVTIKAFANGLSGKLENGDIVSLIATDVGEMRKTIIPPELQYVEIIAITNSDGTDNEVQKETEDGGDTQIASTITVLASPEQACILADYEQNSKLHAALVYRGTADNAKKFLEEQTKVLEELYPPEESEEVGKAGKTEKTINAEAESGDGETVNAERLMIESSKTDTGSTAGTPETTIPETIAEP